jgi:nucleoside-diphosphate-sugar epimerase
MKALLTGASSFSGLWFARALAERGIKVVAPLRRKLDDYSGVRAERVKALANVAEIISGIEFGSPDFFGLVDRLDCDILCHHAARVEDYRSPAFDVGLALIENTKNFRQLSERLKARGFKAVIITGSVFEPDEGAGDEPRRAFSPYGVSKAVSATVIRYWCEISGLPLGKFVIPNPFGPLEEPRFCAYLANTWAAGNIPEVRTPRYVRDNIHIDLLAKAYANFAIEVATSGRSGHLGPTGYVENQGAFAERFAREMGKRFKTEFPVKIGEQSDFSEPMKRINTDRTDEIVRDWNEHAAWDAIADYYAPALKR